MKLPIVTARTDEHGGFPPPQLAILPLLEPGVEVGDPQFRWHVGGTHVDSALSNASFPHGTF
jgi:hypothetical protein